MIFVDVLDLALQGQEGGLADQPGPLWILGQAGIIGAIVVTFGMLHRSVVNAYKDSATKSDKIADLERKRADTTNDQLMQILSTIRKASDSM